VLAGVGWWWSVRMTSDMHGSGGGMSGMDSMESHDVLSLGAFLVAWLAMMTAMMFPAISPMVRLYNKARAEGRVAPLLAFLAGYIAVWTALGVPGYVGWRALMDPIAEGRPWAGRLAGVVLVAAAVWQITPVKSICLGHCRSPKSCFLRFRRSVTRPVDAFWMGVTQGLYCLGSCWALMAVLVAVGTMNLGWMAALALLILLEKNAPHGERIVVAAAVVLFTLGAVLVVHPSTLPTLT
jgi:predicted metal-binding membrane protein